LLFLLQSVLSRRRRSSPLRRPGDGLAERPLPRSRRGGRVVVIVGDGGGGNAIRSQPVTQ